MANYRGSLPIPLLKSLIKKAGSLRSEQQGEEEVFPVMFVAHIANRGRSHTMQHWGPRIRAIPGEGGQLTFLQAVSWVARAAKVSAESGHSLGRRRQGERLGHPKGRKSWQGKHTDAFHRDRDTGKHTEYAVVPTNNKCNIPHTDTACSQGI